MRPYLDEAHIRKQIEEAPLLSMATFWRYRTCVEIVFIFDINAMEPPVLFDCGLNPDTDQRLCDNAGLRLLKLCFFV